MNNRLLKGIIIFSVSIVSGFILFGCSNTNKNSTSQPKQEVQQIEKDPVGSPVDLGAGTFTSPRDIKPGIYDLTITGQGNGNITATNENTQDRSLSFSSDPWDNTTIEGKDDMHSVVDKMRIKVIDGTKLNINGVDKTHFEPVKDQPQLTDTIINAGRYENFKPGRYTITALYGNGAVYIMNKNGSEQQQILSDGIAGTDPKSATVDIKKDDVIFNSGIRQIQFKYIGE